MKEVYSPENRMEEVKVATDNGNIVSYMLSKVSDLEASSKALVDGNNALRAIIITLYVMKKGHKAQELFYDWYA